MKNLIPNDYTRCVSQSCSIRNSCKISLQLEIDKENNNIHVYNVNFNHRLEKDCKFYIENN